MAEPTPKPKPEPTGSRLVRLADVPLPQRLRAYAELIRFYDISEEEAQTLLPLVLNPGDRSTRVAA